MNSRILSFEEIQNLIKPIAEENDLESVYLFGSYGRGDAGKDSDIDILFTTKGKIPGMIQICDLKFNFSKALGKEVDIFFIKNINDSKYDHFRKDIRQLC